MMSVRSSIFLFVIASVALLNVASCFTSSTAPSLITNRRALASRRNSGRPMYAVAKKTKKTTKKTKKTAKKSDAPETFKKAEFVSSIAEKTGFTKADSEAALAAVLETITEEVALGKRISLLGFGTFKLSYRKARKGRNPKTGEEIDIKESFSPSFSASKAFKEKVNPDR
uniref:DNA-binding protein HU n=1 Tax=Ditylum brightwellii TaxID=49249 RepID=A0A6U3TZN0_9STRA|mmetsp:Transcript_33387/g.49777  ORF Transcript_33387/g.49777 Transcript_33387/m.49777 type:complete len:170 (+) Transcript_33387:108-617(+)